MPHEPSDLTRQALRGANVVTIDGQRVTCRPFVSLEDTEACVDMQREVWGADFDHVPASLLQVMLHIGGLAIGAFDTQETLLGFVFSIPGHWHGEAIHWSHMLAVRQSARDMGLGRTLKQLQRVELARRGIARMMWTFDPLQARNAHLNLNRLGVRVVEYVENMYGITRSPLHHGLATDRLIVSCSTSIDPNDPAPRAYVDVATAPILSPFPRAGDRTVDYLARQPSTLLVEIPHDFQEIVQRAPDQAAAWRDATRTHFVSALRDGYRVAGLVRDPASDRAFYALQLVPSTSLLNERLRASHRTSPVRAADPPPSSALQNGPAAAPAPSSPPAQSPTPHPPPHRSDV